MEFNARFGDLETRVVLPRPTGGPASLLLAAAVRRLAGQPPLTWHDAAVTVVVAAARYPTAPRPGARSPVPGHTLCMPGRRPGLGWRQGTVRRRHLPEPGCRPHHRLRRCRRDHPGRQ